MELVIDVGNTTCRVYLFDRNKVRATGVIFTDSNLIDVYLENCLRRAREWGVTKTTVVSVVPALEGSLKGLIEAADMNCLIVNHGEVGGILTGVPENLGPDRIADLAGSRKIFGQACIVADLGTALTVDAIDAQGCYLGGVIFPGPDTASFALAARTAALPAMGWLGLSRPPVLPRGTKSGMEAGLVWGYQDLISGFVKRFKEEMEPTQIKWAILTGGGAGSLVELPPGIQYYEPYLTAKGAAIIGQS